MTSVFIFCAAVGGTIMVCQFVLSLVGLSHDMDIADDFSHDAPGDLHIGSADHAGDGGEHAQHSHDHGSSWLFGVISFRTLVAAFAFFGLAGLAAESGGLNLAPQLVISLASGIAAMFGVHYIMKQLGRLGEDSTIRIYKAVGLEATVYVPIPADKASAGKVQLTLQNRLVEYEAITAAGERLATGSKVRVTAVRGNTLEVTPIHQPALAAKA